ncbi:MAG: preprotein translocase subunit YajC [Rhodospirillaceae bacterium]|nr:preprotein translocase subunit YajC [Rhodospirillaceae bacterium]
MFISTAFAQEAGAADGGGGLLIQILPLVLIFVVFYLLLIRPQQKRMKTHREMLGALRRGDRVVTGGGIVGTVTKTGDDELTVEIAEGVRVRVLRSTVSTVLSKTEPVRERKRPAGRRGSSGEVSLDKTSDADDGAEEGAQR